MSRSDERARPEMARDWRLQQGTHEYSGLGLTLAELILGVAFGAILLGAGVLHSARLLASIRLPLSARQLATDLSLARATAVLRNTHAWVTFDDNRYIVRYESGEPSQVQSEMHPGIRVVGVPGSGSVRFFPSGRADNGTVVLATSLGRSRSVVINQRGRIVVR